MKNAICILSLMLMGGAVFAQSEEVKLQYSDPGKPGLVKIHLVNGGLSVTGHDSPDIVVRFAKMEEKSSKPSITSDGLRRIRAKSPQLEIEEVNNKVEISSNNWQSAFDIEVLVPYESSLSLKCVNEGDIFVHNVKGDIETHNINGGIELTDIAGSVVAHSINQNLKVVFKDLDTSKPMSFTSLNGDVDVTFPENLNSKFLLESKNGDIYTAFDIELKQNVTKEDGERNGRRRISYKSQMIGIVGSGGPEMTMKSFHGDIYIRKN